MMFEMDLQIEHVYVFFNLREMMRNDPGAVAELKEICYNAMPVIGLHFDNKEFDRCLDMIVDKTDLEKLKKMKGIALLTIKPM